MFISKQPENEGLGFLHLIYCDVCGEQIKELDKAHAVFVMQPNQFPLRVSPEKQREIKYQPLHCHDGFCLDAILFAMPACLYGNWQLSDYLRRLMNDAGREW